MALPSAAAAGMFFILTRLVDYEPGGLAPFYESFRAVIAAGFDSRAATADTTTFPMWGYGFLLLATTSPMVLSWLQFGFGLVGAFLLLLTLENGGDLTHREAKWTRWLLVLALPWYATMLSAYSAPAFGGALLMIAVSAVLSAIALNRENSHRWPRLAAGGIAFGLMLNFRSDYLYAAPLICLFILYRSPGGVRAKSAAILAWAIPIAVLLLPWGLYTMKQTGRFMLTSTNSGHVLYVGLGNLPNNRWGITTSDGDPAMRAEIRSQFGDDRSSLRADTDKFLGASVQAKILASPLEYAKKCAWALRALVLDGFYPGVFDADLKQRIRARFGELAPAELVEKHWGELPGMLRPRSVLMVVSELQGRIVLWLGLVAMIWKPFRRRVWASPALMLLASLSLYQIAINVAVSHLRIYTSNQFISFAIFVTIFICDLEKRRRAKRISIQAQ